MKFRDHLKTYYTARIAAGQPLAALASVSVHEKEKWESPHLFLLVLGEHYLEEGNQDGANCNALVQVQTLVSIGKEKSYEQARNETDQLIKLFYKDLRDNRLMGTDWIKKIYALANFFYGVVQHDGSDWEIGGMQFDCDFFADDF